MFGVGTHMLKNPIILLVALCAVVVAAFAIPAFIRARNTPASNACVSNLRNLDGATQQWALDNRKTTNDIPSWTDVRPYMSETLVCPQGGTYSLGRLDSPPGCSIGGPGHTLQ